MLHMVCLNVRKTCADLLDEVLGSIPHRLTFHAPPEKSLHEGPGSRPKLGAVYASLREFVARHVVGWQDDEPLVLLAGEGANDFVRHWLRRDEDRELVNAVVLLDALRGPSRFVTSFNEEFSGIVEFARDCLADPAAKMLLAVGPSAPAGSAHSVGFGALLRHAVWSTASPGEGADTATASNIEIIDLPESDGNELPQAAATLLRSHLVPFVMELGPASAPEPPLG